MPKYGFKPRFKPFLLDGSKPGTIRAIAKYPPKPGAYIYFYPPRFTKPYTAIMPRELCTDVKTIFVLPNRSVFVIEAILTRQEAWRLLADDAFLLKLQFHDDKLTAEQKDALAWLDGFRHEKALRKRKGCFKLMYAWWEKMHNLANEPFAGHHIFWK